MTVDAFPTGIDHASFEAMLNSPLLKDKVIELQRRFDGKSLILGIDRMDYVKGIPHKLIALEKFLEASVDVPGATSARRGRLLTARIEHGCSAVR